MNTNLCHFGDCRDTMRRLIADGVRAQMCVTSPPYWALRDYGHDGQLGLESVHDCLGWATGEPCGECHVCHMVDVFRLVRDLLADDGTCWINYGDSYASAGGAGWQGKNGQRADRRFTASRDTVGLRETTRRPPNGLKPKDLVMMPARIALALQADGWFLRQDIIWHKCLSGGARVYARTQKGDMPMTVKDLVRLDPATVQLWNGTQWTRAVSWERAARKGNEMELVLRSGERIGCTPEHRWPTQRGIVSTAELRTGDAIEACRLPEPETPRNPTALPDDIGWFVGLYIAEGSMSDGTIQIASHANEIDRFDRVTRLAESFDGYAFVYRGKGNTASINVNCPAIAGILAAYVAGRTAHDKHLDVRCWRRGDGFLRAVLDGYLSGDGHWTGERWRLGFCNNDNLAADLRTLCARLGLSLRLKRTRHSCNGKKYPGWRGEIRDKHRNSSSEVVAVVASRGRQFWDIAVADGPHLFALASGVLTHNSNPMPESVTDRCTKSHEYLFLLSKSERYYFDNDAIKEDCTQNEMANGFRGGSYCNNETFDNAEGGKRKSRGNYKTPDGWDTSKGAGGHGSFHKNGREKGHVPGNKTHKGTTAYEAGAEEHRTKAGLVKYAEKVRGARDSFKRDDSKRAAVIPGQSVGTHRPDRTESEWDTTRRNKRDVWTVATQPYSEAHFACVDAETEALTPNGWMCHGVLNDGDLIAAYNRDTAQTEWQRATFHRYDYDGELVVIEKRDSSQRLTPNHRCLVKRRVGGECVVLADELKPGMQIPVTAPLLPVCPGPQIGCELAALIGWYVTEGERKRGNIIRIHQSESANGEKVAEIRRLLSALSAEWTEQRREREWRGRPSVEIVFGVRGEVANKLYSMSGDKTINADWLNWPKEEIEAFVNAVIDGDGHRRVDGRRCVVQKDKEFVDALQIMALRLGWRAHVSKRKQGDWIVYFTDGGWLTLRATNGEHKPLGREYYKGVVWCPSVESTFWIARRNGKPFITGNTFPPALIEPCILAGSRPGDIVLDPFFGSGTTGQVAQALGRKWIGCEINYTYKTLQDRRTAQTGMVFA